MDLIRVRTYARVREKRAQALKKRFTNNNERDQRSMRAINNLSRTTAKSCEDQQLNTAYNRQLLARIEELLF